MAKPSTYTSPAITPSQQPPPQPSYKCRVTEQPDGGMQVLFLIDPDIAKRMRLRANNMALDKYLWENVLYRALIDHVY